MAELFKRFALEVVVLFSEVKVFVSFFLNCEGTETLRVKGTLCALLQQ